MNTSAQSSLTLLILCALAALLGAAPAAGQEETAGDPVLGEKRVEQYGCRECHTIHGEGGGGEVKAPEWAGIFGTIDEMEGGEMVEINEAYLRESIIDPEAKIVKDYPSGKMPTRFKHLPEKDLAGIIAYIKSLAPTETGAPEGAASLAAGGAAPAVVEQIRATAGSGVVWVWMFLGFGSGIFVTFSAILMARNVSWGWVALILAIPAVGLGAGISWAGLAAGTGWPGSTPEGADVEFNVVARQFAYDPPIIKVNRGDRVSITLTSEDMYHGFYVDGYGIDEEVRPDETVRFAFVANKAGRFGIRCSHTCGVFHPFMIGTLIVEPNHLFPGSIGLCFGLGLGTLLYAVKKEG